MFPPSAVAEAGLARPAAAESLTWLGVDCIDLYWLHRDDTRVPVGQIVETLNTEIRRGTIRYLGASNWHRSRIEEANAYARTHHLQGFVASQPEWNLGYRNGGDGDPTPGTGREMRYCSKEDREWYRQAGLTVIPYSGAAGGFFASLGERAKTTYGNAISLARLERACELAIRHKATPGQIALAWLLNQDIPVIPIIGSLHLEHLTEDLNASTLRLSKREVVWLEEGGE